jgi:hypothetical protein
MKLVTLQRKTMIIWNYIMVFINRNETSITLMTFTPYPPASVPSEPRRQKKTMAIEESIHPVKNLCRMLLSRGLSLPSTPCMYVSHFPA